MKWIGLTGGIASGKSSVTKLLRGLSYNVIDADEIAHQIVAVGSTGLTSVIREFGPDVLCSDGSLDRRELGKKVFGNSSMILKLENILHPLVRARVAELRAQLSSHSFVFYDVPLLFEKRIENEFDLIVVVTCTLEQQFERLRRRNNLSDDEIQARLNSQLPLSVKVDGADFIVNNDEGPEKLMREVNRMIDFIQPRLSSIKN